MSESIDHIVARLRGQISQGQPVLFIGAGFSLETKNLSGDSLPTTSELTQELWRICFPDDEFNEQSRLGDVYEAAKLRGRNAVESLLKERLAVDPKSVPDFYKVWFDVPWFRCYSLNIDDLELAAAQHLGLRRPIRSVSATSETSQGPNSNSALEVVHLNGAIWDDPDNLTFSEMDYATRSTTPEIWFAEWSRDVLSRPVVFVGTELHESPLWQYVEYRKRKGSRRNRELRPGSCLVTPTLDPARRIVLTELNIDWIPMTAAEFAERMLVGMKAEVEAGHRVLASRADAEQRVSPRLVIDLLAESRPKSGDYLLGTEPAWSDIQEGVAVERECDAELHALAQSIIQGWSDQRCMVITGTAASGKSTCAMRLALRLSATGIATYWIDEESNIDPHSLRELVTATSDPVAIFVDDADLFGRIATSWARDLPTLRPHVLLVLCVRSTKLDSLVDQAAVGSGAYTCAMPPLADSDIDALLATLDHHNRLGILKGRTPAEQFEAFSREAGRQLLVAMIKATSGRELRERVFDEFAELPSEKKFIYAMIALVHSQRFTLDRDEILAAIGQSGNETLNSIEQLAQSGIITRRDILRNYRTRHRYIADELINGSAARPYIAGVLESVCFAFATRVRDDMPRHARPWRRLIRFLNHQYIKKIVAPEDGRRVYARVEDILTSDFHFWLQRGSFELVLDDGDLGLATNFLGQARGLAPGDIKVETAYAHLLMKKAARNPSHSEAPDWLDEGRDTLLGIIEGTGSTDPYPYHVLGSQGLSWVRRAPLSDIEKRGVLASLLRVSEKALSFHPHADDLAALHRDIKAEWLATTVEKPRP